MRDESMNCVTPKNSQFIKMSIWGRKEIHCDRGHEAAKSSCEGI